MVRKRHGLEADVGHKLRGWRVLSAIALMAVGLAMGAAVAGAQAAPTTGDCPHSATVPHQPGSIPHGTSAARGGPVERDGSRNWSGQIATGLSFTGIRQVGGARRCADDIWGNSATWVGIDGGPASPQSIIQTGTDQYTQDGVTLYTAWYELYPAVRSRSVNVSPGDQMSAIHREEQHQRLDADAPGCQHRRDRHGIECRLRRSRRFGRVDRGSRRPWAPPNRRWPTSAR